MKKLIAKKVILMCIIFICLFLLSILEKNVGILIRNKNSSTISIDWSFYLFNFGIFCLSGIIFGMDFFINEKSKQGKWKVNLVKICIYGIPSLLFASYLIILIPIPFVTSSLILYRICNINLFINLAQIFFGYTLITSFYKDQ